MNHQKNYILFGDSFGFPYKAPRGHILSCTLFLYTDKIIKTFLPDNFMVKIIFRTPFSLEKFLLSLISQTLLETTPMKKECGKLFKPYNYEEERFICL